MKNYKFIISFFLIFIFFLPVQSSQKNKLNQLFDKLVEVDNYKDAKIIEKKKYGPFGTNILKVLN